MKNTLFAILCVTVVCLRAQTPPDAKSQSEALKLRGDMAEAVSKGGESPEAAVARLKAHGAPTGYGFAGEADFAVAAIDVGQRLVAGRKAVAAIRFFQGAESALESATRQLSDKDARNKAMLLQQLAFIRGRFLGKYGESLAAYDQALALQPEDKSLQRARQMLLREHADLVRPFPGSKEASQ